MKERGPWQAWVAAALSGASTVLYVVVVTRGATAPEDVANIIGIAASLGVAAACTAAAALGRHRRTALGLLWIALVPLLVWGVLGAWTIGGLFLLAAAFVMAASWSVGRHRVAPDTT